MGVCKRCGSGYIVKTVKTEINEVYYSETTKPDKIKKKITIKYKCKDCGATKTIIK